MKKEHVANEMAKTAMHEHASKKREEVLTLGDLTRDEGIGVYDLLERAGGLSVHEAKCGNVYSKEDIRDEGSAAGRIVVS